MTPPHRAKLVLLVLAVALVGLGVWAWEPVYWWVMTERVWEEGYGGNGDIVRGWFSRSRWRTGDRYGPGRNWYVWTGYKATEWFYETDDITALTCWNPDGTLEFQRRETDERGWAYWKPPWRWGVTEQTESTMPEWMKDDAKWQAALDAQE